MSIGVRWAEITRVSQGTPNSAQASAAAFMVGQSESLPMMMPTSGAERCGLFWGGGVSGFLDRFINEGGSYGFKSRSVTAPSDALATWSAYFASTPRV